MDFRNSEQDNYRNTLDNSKMLLAAMTDAYSRQAWVEAFAKADEIGKLYAPNDAVAASMISYIVDTTFGAAWFDSRDAQRKAAEAKRLEEERVS